MNVGAKVGIVMGSDSDLEVMRETGLVLEAFGVAFEMMITSAHRTPEKTAHYIREAAPKGLQVLIAGAGAAAHLAGIVAAHTHLPVIGVPLVGSPLNGFDALLSTVQMPGGIPVASMAIGKAGAKNAALFAIAILALQDPELNHKLQHYRQEMTSSVEQKNNLVPEAWRVLNH